MTGTIETDPIIPITTDRYSFGYIIREGWLSRLAQVPDFASSIKKFERNRMKGAIQGENIPYLAVYFMEEKSSPDGDSNAGPPKFIHLLKLGFQVIVQSNDNVVAEHNCNQAHWSIMNVLHSQDWFRFKMPPPHKFVEIEGVEGFNYKHIFGNTMLNNETPLAEMQMDMTFKFRSYFEPYVTDRFEVLHVEVAPKWPYDPAAYVPPFLAQYDLPQN